MEEYKEYSIELYDTRHRGFRAKITRLDGQSITTFPLLRDYPFLETGMHENLTDALAEAKMLIDGGGFT